MTCSVTVILLSLFVIHDLCPGDGAGAEVRDCVQERLPGRTDPAVPGRTQAGT